MNSEPQCRLCWFGVLRFLGRSERPGKAQQGPLFARDEQRLKELAKVAFAKFDRFQTEKLDFIEYDPKEEGKVRSNQLKELCRQLQFDFPPYLIDQYFSDANVKGDRRLDLAEWSRAVCENEFHYNLMYVMLAPEGFKVSVDYNYDLSTEQNYNENGFDLVGSDEFINFRELLVCAAEPPPYQPVIPLKPEEMIPHKKRANYVVERQRWQENLVRKFIPEASSQHTPWLILTCGPVGGGADDAIVWMRSKGFLPLSGVVHISKHKFAQWIPELSGYAKRMGKDGVIKCYKEAQLLADLARELAMSRYHNVWFDSAGEDMDLLTDLLHGFRKHHNEYRIAVLECYSTKEDIESRRKEIQNITGRELPDAPTKPNILVLETLATLADFAARVECSDGEIPHLEMVLAGDSTGSWHTLQHWFAGTSPVSHKIHAEFPQALPPVTILKTGANHIVLDITSGPTPVVGETGEGTLNVENLGRVGKDMRASRTIIRALGNERPECHFSLVTQKKFPGGIAAEMVDDGYEYCAWLYPIMTGLRDDPLQSDSLTKQGLDPDRKHVCLLRNGGWIYWDKDWKVKDMHALAVPGAYRANGDGKKKESLDGEYLQFGPPKELPSPVIKVLHQEQRWRPVADMAILERGGEFVCYITPAEQIGDAKFAAGGSFAYLLKKSQWWSWERAIVFDILE